MSEFLFVFNFFGEVENGPLKHRPYHPHDVEYVKSRERIDRIKD